jgi:hypothetical protein
VDYIWIIIVVLGFISSMFNKSKTKSKNSPGNMPTFGGGREGSLQPDSDDDDDEEDYDYNETVQTVGQYDQDVSAPTTTRQSFSNSEPQGRRMKEPPSYEGGFSSSPNYSSGEGVSQMMADNMESRKFDMQKDVNRVTARLDKISAKSSDEYDAYSLEDTKTENNHLIGTANQAVNGIIWSEILGPPRAKRSFRK